MDIGLLLRGTPLAISAAKYIGLIEDQLQVRIDQLVGSELDAGMKALRQAASSRTEKDHLLREARMRFNKAVGLEKGLRLAHAHLGLATCHSHLGDDANARDAMTQLKDIPPPALEARDYAKAAVTLFLTPAFAVPALQSKVKNVEADAKALIEIQALAAAFLESTR